jgi:uncharacterized protein YjbJ (UPF0337 family)
MNKDQAQGKAKEAVGGLQQKAGELTGDEDLEAQGADKRVEGKTQGAVGKVKHAASDVKDVVKDAVRR